MLSAVGVVAGYRSGQPVLDGVDLDVAPGEVVGLAGPSGCGKSTLARVLALLLAPWGGQVRLDGQPVRRFRHAAPREQRMVDASTTAALVRAVTDHTERTGAGVLAISHDEALLGVWADRVVRLTRCSGHRPPWESTG